VGIHSDATSPTSIYLLGGLGDRVSRAYRRLCITNTALHVLNIPQEHLMERTVARSREAVLCAEPSYGLPLVASLARGVCFWFLILRLRASYMHLRYDCRKLAGATIPMFQSAGDTCIRAHEYSWKEVKHGAALRSAYGFCHVSLASNLGVKEPV
jgi:hypothetical protein